MQFWDYEYIPEIAHTAIPRQLQQDTYNEWAKQQSKDNMNKLIRTFGKLVNSEISRYQGTLQRPVLLSFAKKYVADAVRSYNPSSGNQLSTHIVNQLQRLHRLNYRNVQGLRSAEDVQSRMNLLTQTKMDLETNLGREPTITEIADRMSVSPKFIHKMHEQMKFEQGSSITADDRAQLPLLTENLAEQEAVDFVYHDLPAVHKKILEYKTGYGGASILSNKDIAKKLKISPVRVTQIGLGISNKIKKQMGHI